MIYRVCHDLYELLIVERFFCLKKISFAVGKLTANKHLSKFLPQMWSIYDIFLTWHLLIVVSWQLTPPRFRDLWPWTLRYVDRLCLPWRQGHLRREELSPWGNTSGHMTFCLEK